MKGKQKLDKFSEVSRLTERKTSVGRGQINTIYEYVISISHVVLRSGLYDNFSRKRSGVKWAMHAYQKAILHTTNKLYHTYSMRILNTFYIASRCTTETEIRMRRSRKGIRLIDGRKFLWIILGKVSERREVREWLI